MGIRHRAEPARARKPWFVAGLVTGAATSLIVTRTVQKSEPTRGDSSLTRSNRAVARAVSAERKRLARDLHDGIAQDLAFIAAECRRLATSVVVPDLERIARVADHAFVVSRLTITRLVADPGDFGGALRTAVAELAERLDSEGQVTISDSAVPAEYQEDVLRIVAEATVNAVRHGHAAHVSIGVAHPGAWTITVTDDGDGFVTGEFGTGFGIITMRERAIALGGHLDVVSEQGQGTTVSVSLP